MTNEPSTRAFSILPLLVVFILVGAAGADANAQTSQYRPAGTFGERQEARTDQLDRAIKAAPWKLGKVYFRPWTALRDAGYYDNLGGLQGESDFRITVGAGLRSYLPLGDGLTAAAHALQSMTTGAISASDADSAEGTAWACSGIGAGSVAKSR